MKYYHHSLSKNKGQWKNFALQNQLVKKSQMEEILILHVRKDSAIYIVYTPQEPTLKVFKNE